jgi:3-hydroxyacyl-CoA dehydrogenase / 3-hydroxy-2-methylbutyryl-CoA dehydrogenase
MNDELGQALVRELGESNCSFISADVTDTESIARAVKDSLAFVKKTGCELGGIIAAAGVASAAKIMDGNYRPFDLQTFDFVMKVNVRGSVDLVRQVLPHLARVEPLPPDNERGVIVLVSSSASTEGQPGQVRKSSWPMP